MTVAQIIEQVQALTADERLELIRQITALAPPDKNDRSRNLMELAGLGAEIWQGVDAQDYVRALRTEWDERP